ncbi:MAG TPA: hypothetical protein VEL51_24530 [Vicinamibacterales bacterium]|nr:hypothetical protein [Vicinamibacterales bacterium]
MVPGRLFYLFRRPAARAQDGRVNRTGFGITYYPGVKSRDGAKLVMVKVDGPVTADITLVPAVLSVVSGVVIGSNDRPVAGGMLGIAHGDGMFGVDSKGLRIRADGFFLLPALPPGTYFLQFHESAWPPPRGETPLVSGARVVVEGRDLAGVRVAQIHMVHATGKVVVDPAVRALFQPAAFTVGAFPVDVNGNHGPQRSGSIRDDLTFEFSTWPSVGWVRVLFDDNGWRVKAVRHGGRDVTATGIEFKAGQEITGIEIELVRR